MRWSAKDFFYVSVRDATPHDAPDVTWAIDQGTQATPAWLPGVYASQITLGSVQVDLTSFEHRAFFNSARHRIEMHLASTKTQRVRVAGRLVQFERGETIHTENSYKYSIATFSDLARRAGWQSLRSWTDTASMFSVHALRNAA